MPTYSCWSQKGWISRAAQTKIAAAITDAHHDIAKAPRYLVQVLFTEVSADAHFIGGHPAPANQVWIHALIRFGRTEEQRKDLLVRLTSEVAEILGVPTEEVWVYISEIPGANMTEYGHLLREPGQEAAWFADLPEALQERLKRQG
ncbi:tautomerase family protein [Corynebacterium sp. A21]|uniref:tautomerase family protein n=1 Tax=Corynebacterium sp. A21 TaxID=3457318 RepID=UPI003FD4EB85